MINACGREQYKKYVFGCKVLGVGSGEAGLNIFRSVPGVGVVLTSVRMRGVNGEELVEKIRRLEGKRSQVPVVMVADRPGLVGVLREGVTIVSKPFEPIDLAGIVKNKLED
jgi:DNA-binding response OmpR family regulator